MSDKETRHKASTKTKDADIVETVSKEIIRDGLPGLEKLDDEAAELVNTIVAKSITVSGPIPPAFIVKDWEEMVPGSGKIMLEMAVSDQKHEQKMQELALRGSIEYQTLGMKFGFGILAMATLGSVALLLAGKPVAGTILGGATMAAIGYAFLKSKLFEKEESKTEDADKK